MQNDTEKLFVQLEARVAGFEKAMARAEKRGTKTYNSLQRNSTRTTRRMERDMLKSTSAINKALAFTSNEIGGFARGFLPVLGAGALAGTVAGITSLARGIADIGREARRAGLDVETFQELGFIADQNRIPIDALTDGLKELNLRADEFITTGAGAGAESFQRLGFGADELKEKLKNPRDLFIEIIERMKEMDRAAQIRISDELFGGTAGERFVELLDAGTDKIREQIAEARNLGIVLDSEVVAKAEEIDKQFAIISRTVGTALKSAIIEAAVALGSFIDQFRAFENQQDASLDKQIAQIGLQKIEIENQILDLKDKQRNATGVLAKAEKQQLQGRINSLKEQQQALIDQEAKIIGILKKRSAVPSPAPSAPSFTPIQPTSTRSRSSRATPSRARSIESARIERDRVSELIVELERELSLIGATDEARRASEITRRAGTDATKEQRARLIDLNEALFQNTQAQRENDQAQAQRFNEIRNGLSGIYRDLKNGEKFTDAFANAFQRMTDRVVDNLINDIASALTGGSSPANSNILSSLFSFFVPTNHTGGNAGVSRVGRTVSSNDIGSAKRYHNGKSGIGHNEVMSLLEKSESVFTAGQTKRLGSALSNGINTKGKQGSQKVHITVGFVNENLNLRGQVVDIAQGEAATAANQAYQRSRSDFPRWQKNLKSTGRP
jgi:hypothetical protein